METLDALVDRWQSRGRYAFSGEEATRELDIGTKAFLAAASRLKRKSRLATPKRGFYLVLRPEDRRFGAPPPEHWISPLMAYLRVDYRISLLRAAAFYGSTHQSAMVFQVVAPRQIGPITLGRQRVQFVFQASSYFEKVNQENYLQVMKSETGQAKIAGIELTLLDAARYFHQVGGISGAAQIARDLGAKANGRRLAQAAKYYENSSVRRLGYLLERFGHVRQANALVKFAQAAKSTKPLDPSVRSLFNTRRRRSVDALNKRWKLTGNVAVEVDA